MFFYLMLLVYLKWKNKFLGASRRWLDPRNLGLLRKVGRASDARAWIDFRSVSCVPVSLCSHLPVCSRRGPGLLRSVSCFPTAPVFLRSRRPCVRSSSWPAPRAAGAKGHRDTGTGTEVYPRVSVCCPNHTNKIK